MRKTPPHNGFNVLGIYTAVIPIPIFFVFLRHGLNRLCRDFKYNNHRDTKTRRNPFLPRNTQKARKEQILFTMKDMKVMKRDYFKTINFMFFMVKRFFILSILSIPVKI